MDLLHFLVLLLAAVTSANSQKTYLVATDEITDVCNCFKFAVSLTYKYSQSLKNIKDKEFFTLEDTDCVAAYTDETGTFVDSSSIIAENVCIPIENTKVLGTTYNYTDFSAAGIIKLYDSIDTTVL